VTLTRLWRPGDRVRLTLPMEVRLRRWERNANAVSVDGGRSPTRSRSRSAGPVQRDERWPAFEVFPQSPWNYGLDLSSPIEVAGAGVSPGGQPFTLETAPVVLKAKGRRIPQWRQEANGLVGEIQASPALTTEPLEDLALVPMGCARLRITAFPEVKAEGATAWPDAPPLAAASTAWHFAPPTAMNDGQVGQSSATSTCPASVVGPLRHGRVGALHLPAPPRGLVGRGLLGGRGGGAQLGPRAARRPPLRPTDGRVRLPAAWRLLYWDGIGWQPASETADYGLARDQFNRVSFRPVVTTALRIEAQLRPRQSAGIVEWRVGP